jgi:hypothetical protein
VVRVFCLPRCWSGGRSYSRFPASQPRIAIHCPAHFPFRHFIRGFILVEFLCEPSCPLWFHQSLRLKAHSLPPIRLRSGRLRRHEGTRGRFGGDREALGSKLGYRGQGKAAISTSARRQYRAVLICSPPLRVRLISLLPLFSSRSSLCRGLRPWCLS